MQVAAVPHGQLVGGDEDVERRVGAGEQLLLAHVLADRASVLRVAPVGENSELWHKPRECILCIDT